MTEQTYDVRLALKAIARRAYVESGGVRGPDGYEPTNREYAALLRGEITGAALLEKERANHVR
jgi:hypothetical protein